jgi:hypothetical protein
MTSLCNSIFFQELNPSCEKTAETLEFVNKPFKSSTIVTGEVVLHKH